MLALLSVWISLISLLVSVAMLLYRPALTDETIVIVLYFASPGGLCFAGLVLWSFRKETHPEPAVLAQRLQARIAIILAIAAAAIVYALIIRSEKFEPIEPTAGRDYNPPVAYMGNETGNECDLPCA